MGKTLSVSKITDQKWLNLFEAKTEHNGKEGAWSFCSRKAMPTPGVVKADAVVIVPFVETKDGLKIGITYEYRYPIGCYEWGFPAGLLDEENESCVLAAKRELWQEMGLTIKKILFVSPAAQVSSAGAMDESVVFVYVLAEGELSDKNLESSEDIVAHLYTQEQIKALLKSKEIISAKASGLYMLFSALGYKVIDYLAELYEL